MNIGMPVDVLLVGSGGREHALAWKLKQSPRMGKLYIAPGNGGTRLVGENVPIGAMEFEKLAAFAAEKRVGLTICSMDDPLAGGIVDFFSERRLRIWGPTKEAAQIESSKVFAKQLMQEAGVPTARFKVFNTEGAALAHLHERGVPVVIKASGLALGKGAYVCRTAEEAERAINDILVHRVHGDAGSEVVIEDFLDGPEISIHALSDGIDYAMFPPSQDHKRALDGDQGENTGGMGVIAPVPWVKENTMMGIESQIVAPVFEQLKKRGIDYRGMLYPGLIVTNDGPKVLEFNARFGDPEAQAYMRLLKSDILDLFEASTDGTLNAVKRRIEWNRGFAVNIVLASGGYPDEYKKELPITGIADAEREEGIVVFHAGTSCQGDALTTAGGRVLGVSAVGSTLKDALDCAYRAIERIHFDGKQYRRDIGAKTLAQT